MRVVREFSLALCCGLLGFGVSAWNATGRATEQESLRFSRFLPASAWQEAIARAEELDLPLLVYAGLSGSAFEDLHADLESDPVLQSVLARFVPVSLALDGSAEDRELAARLGLTAAPDFLVVSPNGSGEPITQRLRTVTGTTFERFGLTSELWAISGGDARAEDRSAEREPTAGINGFDERSVLLQAAIDSFVVPEPADGKTALEEHLMTEGNKELQFRGWSLLASWFERSARASVNADGKHLGVPTARWEARLRGATRKVWISCPDDHLLPFGALLVERFARTPEDLDSLDRAFVAAVIRTLAKTPGSDVFPAKDWLAEAQDALPPR